MEANARVKLEEILGSEADILNLLHMFQNRLEFDRLNIFLKEIIW
jgi:hypothetical protein